MIEGKHRQCSFKFQDPTATTEIIHGEHKVLQTNLGGSIENTAGYRSEYNPKSTNMSVSGRAENRRTEIIINAKTWWIYETNGHRSSEEVIDTKLK